MIISPQIWKDAKQVLIRGVKSGLRVLKEIALLMFVIYVGMEILNRTGWINLVADFCSPVMNLCGLPGEAAIVVLLGITNGIYGSLAAFMAIELTPWQINTLGMMVLISHNIFSEGGILYKCGMPYYWMVIIKLGISFLLGMARCGMDQILHLGGGGAT